MFKLTFVDRLGQDGYSEIISPSVIEGADEGEILQKWNQLPGNLQKTPEQFRMDLIGAYDVKDPSSLPAFDDHLLDSVVRAAGPKELTLEETTTAKDSIRKAIRQAI